MVLITSIDEFDAIRFICICNWIEQGRYNDIDVMGVLLFLGIDLIVICFFEVFFSFS